MTPGREPLKGEGKEKEKKDGQNPCLAEFEGCFLYTQIGLGL